jgi:hypothetical protein
VASVVTTIDVQGACQESGAAGILPNIGDGFKRANEDAGRITGALGNAVEHVVDSVGDVDKGPPAGSEHRAEPRCFTTPAVAGAIVEAPVCFRLDDTTAPHGSVGGATPDLAAEEILRDVNRVPLEEARGKRLGHGALGWC